MFLAHVRRMALRVSRLSARPDPSSPAVFVRELKDFVPAKSCLLLHFMVCTCWRESSLFEHTLEFEAAIDHVNLPFSHLQTNDRRSSPAPCA